MDYYNILGIDKSVDNKVIKQTYKKLANIWHPDKNPDNKDAENKFKEISEAYKILSDPETRILYDNGVNYNNNEDNIIIDDIPDVIVPVKISLNDLYTGKIINVTFERFNLCKKCIQTKCLICKGAGISINNIECNNCNGSGYEINLQICSNCDNNTYYKEICETTVTVPKGVENGYEIKISNIGNMIPDDDIDTTINNTRSDVIFKIYELPHNIYKRGIVIQELDLFDINSLTTDININFIESIFGFEKNIETLDNKIKKITFNNIIKNNDIYVLKKYGMPILDSEKYGNLYIKINVEQPVFSDNFKLKLWNLFKKEFNLDKFPTYQTNKDLVSFNNFIEQINKNNKNNIKDKYLNRKK